jgi:hypothetical protein
MTFEEMILNACLSDERAIVEAIGCVNKWFIFIGARGDHGVSMM